MVLAVAGSVMTAPELENGAEVITPDDYPERMLRRDQSAFEDVRVVVSPDGKPAACAVIAEVRNRKGVGDDDKVGQYSCDLFIRRGRFRPAVDVEGHPTYGTYSVWVSWQTQDLSYKAPDQVDTDVSVAALPKDMPDPALVDVDIAVGADGMLGSCVAAAKGEHSSSRQVVSPQLAAVACAQLKAVGKLMPALDRSGEAVPSVQRIVTRFATATAASAKKR